MPVAFRLAPTQTLATTCRFYLKSVRPTFQLYVSPLNLDPLDPALPISTPASFAAELAAESGRFYTLGMPVDTNVLAGGVLSADEFLAQAKIAGDEVVEQYRLLLDRFTAGLLFYYFGNVDQVQHMMFRPMDPGHPAYDAARDAPYSDVVPSLYAKFDEIVGYTLARIGPETTLVVMSDHGFASWRRSMNLNSWLREPGLPRGARRRRCATTPACWPTSTGVGRAPTGSASTGSTSTSPGASAGGSSRRASATRSSTRSPSSSPPPSIRAPGERAVTAVHRCDREFADGGALDLGPDAIVGYARGTRCSDASALGELTREVFSDNTGEWSGDHCMDPTAVPGILATNRRLQRPAPRLRDLAAAILAEFGVEGFPAPVSMKNEQGR